MSEALIVFVKNPELGKVKTRLAKDAGEEKALEVYLELLRHTREIVLDLDCDRRLHYSSEIPASDDWSLSWFDKFLQVEGDLGQRMERAFEQAFQEAYNKVIIIGSDCADLSTALIQEAFEGLADHDFVIGPAKDGGYYLLGMQRLERSLFQNKDWSTASLYGQTLEDFERLEASYLQLPVLSDIDYYQDYLDHKARRS